MVEKPVMYLDVDGVLWTVDGTGYHGAIGLAEFMMFALEHYEVRWCTAWAVSGKMDLTRLAMLSEWTGVDILIWVQVESSFGWHTYKTETIDWGEVERGRRFVWIEDEILSEEYEILRQRGIEDWYIHTNVLVDSKALLKTLTKLRECVAAAVTKGDKT